MTTESLEEIRQQLIRFRTKGDGSVWHHFQKCCHWGRFCLVAFFGGRAGLIKRVQPFCFSVIVCNSLGRYPFARYALNRIPA